MTWNPTLVAYAMLIPMWILAFATMYVLGRIAKRLPIVTMLLLLVVGTVVILLTPVPDAFTLVLVGMWIINISNRRS